MANGEPRIANGEWLRMANCESRMANGEWRTVMTEWNASEYHRVSGPQFSWGLKVLERLDLTGVERVVDAGCGSGRLTGELLARWPEGQLLAIDR